MYSEPTIKVSENQVPIAFAFTKNYVVQAATTMRSILVNAKKNASFHFICLSAEELPEDLKIALQSLQKQFPTVVFTFLNLGGKFNFEHSGRFTNAAYYRLLLADIFPTINKMMYIDCDTIVQSDLAELFFKTNLEHYYVAAIKELVLDFQIQRLTEIACDPENYLNSGFLLLNLDKIRQDNLVATFLEASKSDKFLFPDQDILNIYCANKILWLSPIYNSINVFRVPAYQDLFQQKFPVENWKDQKTLGTLHYTGSAKPWKGYTLDFEKWWQYYNTLPQPIRNFQEKDVAFFKMKVLSTLWSIPVFSRLIVVLKKIKKGLK